MAYLYNTVLQYRSWALHAHESDQLGESKKIYDEHIRKQLLEKSNKTSRQNTADL